MLRIPHCLQSRQYAHHGGNVVSPTHWTLSTPQEHYFFASGTHFCYELSKPQGLVRAKGLVKLKKIIHSIRSRIRDLQACNIVPQQLRYSVAPTTCTTTTTYNNNNNDIPLPGLVRKVSTCSLRNRRTNWRAARGPRVASFTTLIYYTIRITLSVTQYIAGWYN
jgi:hypothetical protein